MSIEWGTNLRPTEQGGSFNSTFELLVLHEPCLALSWVRLWPYFVVGNGGGTVERMYSGRVRRASTI